ncbi:hypothetical protein KF840_12855 [bacterium]|nr:hypothetical protein [bacterium]
MFAGMLERERAAPCGPKSTPGFQQRALAGGCGFSRDASRRATCRGSCDESTTILDT